MPSPQTTCPGSATRYNLLSAFTSPITAPKGECTICLEPLSTSTDSACQITRCKHTAHASCLLKWSEEKSSCPYCRQEMFAPLERKYAIPFEFGDDFVVSEMVYRQWESSCTSKEEEKMVKGFKEVEGEWVWNCQGKFEGLRGFF